MALRRKFNLEPGDIYHNARKPELDIIGDGALTYVWIGDPGCYGTISGKKNLEALAFNILKALGQSPRAAMKKTKYNG